MASKDVEINIALNGGSKIDQIINKAAQLEGIINGINKTPLDLNVQKAISEFDKFDTNLKAIKAGISTQQKALDQAAGAIDKYTEKIVSTQRQLSNLNPNTKKYNEVLARQEDAIKSLAKAKGDLSSIEKKLAADEERLPGVQKAAGRAKAAKIATEAISALADEYLRLGAAQEKGTKGQILKNQSQSTIARLSAQAEALKLVADNSEIASSQFNRFAIASQVASQKVYEGRQKKLNALAFGLSQSAPNVNIGTGGQSSIAAARQTIDSVIGSFGGVVKSEAALSSYVERLRSLQSLVPYLSEEYGRLERAIGDVSAEMESLQRMTQLRGAVSEIQPQAGPASLLPSQSVKSAGEQAKYFQKRNDYQERLLGVEERISQANLNTLQKTELRTRLDKALGLLAENRLDDAKRETIELEKQRMSLERMNRAQKPLTFGALGTGFSPISGEMPGGAVISGSPAAKFAEAKANRESTQAAVALAQQKQKAVEQEAEELRKGTQAATALGKQKLKALEDEAELLRKETSNAVALAQQKMREEEKVVADAWKMRGGPALPPGFTEAGRVQQRGGTYRTGEFSPIGGNRRFENIKASGAIVEQGLINLQNKGVDVTEQLKNLQKALNAAKEEGFDISIKTLDALNDQVVSAGRFAQLQNKVLAGQSKSGKTKAAGSGLQAALEQLKEARGASKAFLGDLNPAEAIDKIVREFNTGNPEINNTAKNLVTTYASEITAGIPAVADAMKNLGIAGIRAIKKALRMASPSRVMLEIAKNQIDTYVDFLRAALPAVEAAAKAIGEAGIPKATGIPKEAIRAPLTEKARTRPLTAEGIDRNKATAIFASSQIAGPFGQLEQVQAKIEDFINKTRTSVDLDKLFAGFSEDARFYMAKMGKSAGPDFDKLRVALADFYQIPAELTPDLDRGVNAAKQASVSGDQLEQYVLELVDGLEKINSLFKATAKLPAPFAAAKIPATATASIAIPDPWETVADTISNSAIDAAIKGGRQIKQAVNDVTSSVRKNIIEDPWADAVGTSSGGAIPPNTPPGGRAGGGGGGAGDFNRRFAEAVQQGPQALLGLGELRQPAKASINELNALSGALAEFRAVLDPTTEGFDRLDNQLRETIGSISRQLERRDPNADFLTRRVGPRGGRAISEGLIGGAFPLLFGQGAGASLGGLLGGAAGGFAGGGLGFGLSLVGTALGTAFDQLGAAATEAGKALRDPISGFEKLKEANLLASKSQEYYIQKLIETGKISQATAIIQSEIIKKIGVSGVNDLNKLAKSSDELSKAWAEFNLQLQVALAGPMAGLLQWVTGIVKAFNQAGNFKSDVENIRSGLTPGQRAKFDKEKLDASVKPYQTLEQQMAAEKKIIEKYRAMAVIKAPSLTIDPAKAEEGRKAAQQAADEIKQAYRSAFSLQRQAIDIEIQATDNRRKVEEDIFRKRQEIARSEADNARTAAQIRIESADLAMRKGFIGAEGEAKTILDAVRSFVKIRSEGEADIEKKRRDLEVTMSDIQRETSNYLYEQAKVRMQMERSIEDYKMSVADYQLETQRKIQNLQEIAQAGVNSGDFSIANIASKKLTPKEKALLATIRFAEGTSGANGYNTMFGGGTFSDLSRHPDRVIRANGRASAAAGAYQFMPDTWNKTLGGGSMAPARQDAGALSLILRRGVDVNKTGFTPQTANKLAPEWASFPTLSGKSYYNQPVKSFNALNSYYQKALKQFEKESGAPSAVKTGQMVGGLPVQQLEQAGAMIRPVRPSLDVNTEGMVASQKTLGQLAKDRLKLERELNRIGVDTAKLGIFEAARGESNIIALSNQLDLERSKYQVISQSANLGRNEIDLLIKKKEGESAISLIKDYQAQAIATINKSVSEGNMKQNVAKEAIAAINRGVEERLVFTKQQQQLEEAILELNQKQAFAEKLANVERQTALAGLEYDLGYAGESASAFREAFDLTNSIQQARQYADAVQRLENLPGLKTKKFVADAVAELNDLESLTIRVSQSIGDAVGNSLNEGITGLIEGTTTAEQVFADFLKNIGQILIQEGAKIIATYIAIGIAKAFAGLAGGGGGATGGPKSDPVMNFNLAASQYKFADGGVFSGNELTAFANGGIVDSPTLFKFADGGAMQTGVMGEAGPEAIMPLQRDANGRLGVKATGVVEALAAARGALSDGQTKGTSDPFAENRQALGGISSVERERNVERIISSGASSTEIKYSRVGSGDLPFVTEEDMLQATRVAAQEGAKLGQQRTLAALKNNPGARRTVGI